MVLFPSRLKADLAQCETEAKRLGFVQLYPMQGDRLPWSIDVQTLVGVDEPEVFSGPVSGCIELHARWPLAPAPGIVVEHPKHLFHPNIVSVHTPHLPYVIRMGPGKVCWVAQDQYDPQMTLAFILTQKLIPILLCQEYHLDPAPIIPYNSRAVAWYSANDPARFGLTSGSHPRILQSLLQMLASRAGCNAGDIEDLDDAGPDELEDDSIEDVS